jgi:hypothetical protein
MEILFKAKSIKVVLSRFATRSYPVAEQTIVWVLFQI